MAKKQLLARCLKFRGIQNKNTLAITLALQNRLYFVVSLLFLYFFFVLKIK